MDGGVYDANEPWVLMRYITDFGAAAADGWAVSNKQGYVPASQGDVTYRLILPGGANAAPCAAGGGGGDDAGGGDEGGDAEME